MAELARKNAAGPLCPAAFSSNLTVLLKNGSDFFFSPEEKKDTEACCAENCRRRTCRLTCLRHSALSAARTHLSRKSVARVAERRTCARRRQIAGTVDRRIGRRREAAVRCYQALSCSCSSRCPRTPRSFPTFCRCRCSFCRRRCCSRNSSCLRGQSSYPVPPRECSLPREAQHIVAAAQNFGQSVGVHRLHFALSLCLGSARELGVGARSAHRIGIRRSLELVKTLDKVPLSVRIRPNRRNSRLARNHILLRIQRIEANLDLRRTCRDIVAVIPGLSNHDRGPARSVVNADRLGLRMRGTRTLIAEVVELSRVGTRKIGGVLLHKIARAVHKASIFAASLP